LPRVPPAVPFSPITLISNAWAILSRTYTWASFCCTVQPRGGPSYLDNVAREHASRVNEDDECESLAQVFRDSIANAA